MKKYILSIDQGTTSTRAILFDNNGQLFFQTFKEVKCIYPNPGWVEVDPIEIWISVVDVVNEILIKTGISWENIDSIGIANQRETTIVWNKETGLPIYNGIVWQSRQSLCICEDLMHKKHYIHQRTGLLINPYFSASKIKFILDNVKGARELAQEGKLAFGTIDSWLIYKMTNHKNHMCDISNASRTMLYNIFDLKWDEKLLKLFNIPSTMMPEVCQSSFDYGTASFFSSNVRIMGVAGDQHASLFGHNCFKEGQCKNTYGTGCFMLLNTGNRPILSQKGLLTTIAWQVNDQTCYALEGSVFIGGAAIQWLRDQLKVINDANESQNKAEKVIDNGGVYVVPAFVGLGTPYWDDEVRGSIFGMSRDTNRNHLIRATLESIAFQTNEVISTMVEESDIKLTSLQVDGGATNNNVLLQFQSDISRIEIKKPLCHEVTALGVAYMAGLQTSFFDSIESISCKNCNEAIYSPKMDEQLAKYKKETYSLAVDAARVFKPGRIK